jgi:hypothetical protein
MQSLKASILDHAACFMEEQGLIFDGAGYEAQASFNLEDIAREMLFFGAGSFPILDEVTPAKPLTIAA